MDPVTHFFGWVCGQNPEHTWCPGGLWLPCCQRCTGLYVGACVAVLLHLCLKPRLSGRFLEVHGGFLLLMVPFGFQWVAQGPGSRTITGVLFGFGVVTFLWLAPGPRLLARATAPPPNRAVLHAARTCRFPNRSQHRRRPHGLSVARILNLLAPWSGGNSNATGTAESATLRGEQVEKPALRGGLPRATAVYFLGVVLTTALVPAVARFGNAQAAMLLTGLALGGLILLAVLAVANTVLGLRGCARGLSPLLARAGA